MYRPDGSVMTRAGLPVLRPPGSPTPCHRCAKPDATPAERASLDWQELRKRAVELAPENVAADAFYRECRAVNDWPRDDLVRWYSGILRDVYDHAERQRLARDVAAAVAPLVGVPDKRG